MSTTKFASTAASSIRCASSCRADANCKAHCWQASTRGATRLTPFSRASRRGWRRDNLSKVKSRRLRKLAVEGQALLAGRDGDVFAILDRTGEDHPGERILHRFLDDAL